jgi:hypothetical protein
LLVPKALLPLAQAQDRRVGLAHSREQGYTNHSAYGDLHNIQRYFGQGGTNALEVYACQEIPYHHDGASGEAGQNKPF